MVTCCEAHSSNGNEHKERKEQVEEKT